MAKVKFKWTFNVAGENQVEVYLNNDINKIIFIEHPSFYENITDILTEINLFQFVHGTKTEIPQSSFNQLRKAYRLHSAWKENSNEPTGEK
jgi:hypothetical protein